MMDMTVITVKLLPFILTEFSISEGMTFFWLTNHI